MSLAALAPYAVPALDPVTPFKVLVVDDDAGVRRLLATALERRGYVVTCAEELEEAAAILMHREYDLLCVDLDLAGLSGLEGLELVAEAHAHRARLRILVSTGNSDPRVHRACLDRGAFGVYLKGTSIHELQRMLDEGLEEKVR